MAKRTKLEQELFKTKKVVRTITRLKHSLAADDEINDRLDVVQKKFEKAAQRGILPAPIDTEKVLKLDVE